MALLRGSVLLKESAGAGRLIAAHFNHRLRGAESDADEAFVRQLARQTGITCEVASGEVPTDSTGDGIEAAARAARYAFLTGVSHRVGARYVLTAHTADDQAETVLHRILRGTGIGGLAGIPRVRELSPAVALLRPFLGVTRQEVLSFLASLPQPFREDSSNAALHFTRNRIRNELLPFLEKEYAPSLRASLLRLARLSEENQSCLLSQLEPLLSRLAEFRGDSVVVDCAGLSGTHRHLVRELFIRIWTEQRWPQQVMTLEKWDELATLALDPAAALPFSHLPGGVRIQRMPDKRWLISRLVDPST